MNVAIVHYHLRRGGVTRVIASALEALRDRGHELLVLTGEAPREAERFPDHAVVGGLGYRRDGNATIAGSLADALRAAAAERFGSPPDLWHFHNHSLGKNVLVPGVVRELAGEGEKVLLQMHDFAEDGRPGNYAVQRSFFESEKVFEDTLYPKTRHVHYATINQRDHGFLAKAGVPAACLHELPNAVTELPVTSTPKERPVFRNQRFLLYPTRGIRRKNLGEALLLAALHRDEVHLSTTLSPENPEWERIHDRWRDLAEELDLSVTLGIADSGEHAFEDLVGWSDAIVTTSIAEGFGLAFLEPWLSRKSVTGRDLPEITRDFTARGIRMDHLYARLEVPVDWIDEEALRVEIDAALRQSYLAYDQPLPRKAVERTWKSWVRKGRIDFGVLSEKFQEQIIRRVASDPAAASAIATPPVADLTRGQITKRAALIERHYSVSSYGDRLEALYREVTASRKGRRLGSLSTKKVLGQFLAPERLNLLRT